MKDFQNLTEKELEESLGSFLDRIEGMDQKAERKARERWSKVAKPLGSLGVLEDDISAVAGITGSSRVRFDKRALVIFCADNGVVEEGVTQTGQEVTAVVTSNFTRGESCACLMAEKAGTDVFPVDIGVAHPIENQGNVHPLIRKRIRNGTRNFLKSPAMSRQEALAALLTGISLVEELKQDGYHIIATGEMGIGNTTTSSAVLSVLTGQEPKLLTGKGAGLSDKGLERKILTIEKGIALHCPDPADGVDVLAKVGGLDLAGLAGVFLGGAVFKIPVVIDGFISAAAAAAARSICEKAIDCAIASHVSAEPAGRMALDFLEKKPAIQAGMCLGEGTGAVALLPLLDMALAVYQEMSTFQEIAIEDYQPL